MATLQGDDLHSVRRIVTVSSKLQSLATLQDGWRGAAVASIDVSSKLQSLATLQELIEVGGRLVLSRFIQATKLGYVAGTPSRMAAGAISAVSSKLQSLATLQAV